MSNISATNDEKISKTLIKVLKIINKNKLNIGELIMLYGNLGYHLGASIAGFTTSNQPGPSLHEVKQAYYENPTVDTGLMLQGLLISSWEEDFLKKPALSRFAQENLQINKNKS